MEFDMVEFMKTALPTAGVLVPIVIALVTWLGHSFGIAGRWQFVASMVSGILLGSGAMISQLGMPADFAGWFALVLFDLILGLSASGLYDAGKELVARGAPAG